MISIHEFRDKAIRLVCNVPAETLLVGLKELIDGDYRYKLLHVKSPSGILTIAVMYEEYKNFWGASRVFEYSNEKVPPIGSANLTMRESFQIHVPIILN